MSQVSMREVANLGELRLPQPFHAGEQSFLETAIGGMAIDSRQVRHSDVFFALQGDNTDGHEYLNKAQDSGAVAAVVERFIESALPQVRVKNSGAALGQLGAHFREKLAGTVIGITGSAGKTSVKNLVRALLEQFGSVSATAGNLNNELGVPLTLAGVPAATDYVVVEMGAAQQGDIAYLVDIAKPAISLVNNVGAAHVGRFGSIETTAQTKGEIYSRLGQGDTAVINLDGDYAQTYIDRYCAQAGAPRAITFSLTSSEANVFASDIQWGDEGLATFKLHLRRDSNDSVAFGPFTAPLPGRHGLANLLAATGIVLACDCKLAMLADAIADLAGVTDSLVEAGRMMSRHHGKRFKLIDDTYNASPDAMKVAIDQLALTKAYAGSVKFLVLGDMAELGDAASQYHYDVGLYAATQGVSHLYAVGEFAQDYLAGFDAATEITHGAARAFHSLDELLDYFSQSVPDNRSITILVKGSRAARMDIFVDKLVQSDLFRGDRC